MIFPLKALTFCFTVSLGCVRLTVSAVNTSDVDRDRPNLDTVFLALVRMEATGCLLQP